MNEDCREPASTALGGEALDCLRRDGVEVAVEERMAIVRRGDVGEAFWVVLEGTVEVRLTGEDGVHLPLARMGPGDAFGEMALLTGDPVSADVVALTRVRLLRCPGERFQRALGSCEPLRVQVMARLAANLRGTSAEVWKFYQQAKALNVLMGPRREEGPIVAESGAMKPVRDAVARLAREEGPLLVAGDPGAGKLFVAAKIHAASARRDGPFIAVDCRRLAAAEAMQFLFGAAAGFGETGGASAAGALRRHGALQLAHEGTLVLRHAEHLPPAVQAEVARYLELRESSALAYPSARLVATTAQAPSSFAAAAAPGLAAALAGNALAVPRMADRRKDVVALARLFLAQHDAGNARELGRSAEHILVSLRYRHRNAAELREAVDMAAGLADEPQIRAEHIFAGPKGEGGVNELDLTQVPLVRRLTGPRALGALRAVVFASFAAIIAASLLRGATPAGQVANALTWGLWEPALFVLFLFVGRLWCTVCPLSTAGRLAARVKCLERSPGAWIKDYSGWYIIAGFLLIMWSEHAFRMTERPRAAGVLLLCLFGAAVLFAVVYRRETWCRYVCPLGNLGAIYSLPAVLTVRAKPDVCATFCTTHECFKGSATKPGCPVFHHPLYASDAHSCKQCFQCLRVCPHGSARLYLRLPLQSVWAQADVGDALVPFAIFLFLFAPAMLASQGASWASTVPGFTATALAALAATLVVRKRLPRLLAAGPDPAQTTATRSTFALLILAWGPAMSFQLRHVPGLESLRLRADAGTALAGLLPAGGVTLLALAQTGATLVAAAAAAVCFAGIRGRLRRDGERWSRAGWNVMLGVAAAYVAGTLALIVTGGVHP